MMQGCLCVESDLLAFASDLQSLFQIDAHSNAVHNHLFLSVGMLVSLPQIVRSEIKATAQY